ncbi:MAG: hypothetical protein RR342_01450 [Bacilli bacterium]|jgi:RNase P subunit RPR2
MTRKEWMVAVRKLLNDLSEGRTSYSVQSALRLKKEDEELNKINEKKKLSKQKVELMRKVEHKEKIRVDKDNFEKLKELLTDAIKLV